MRAAWRAAVEPIAASAATVILGLLCLQLSELGNTRGLGPVGAFGIAGAFIASLTFLPAVLLLIGRRIFWPGIPQVDHAHAEDSIGRRGIWGRVARMIGAHARRTWIVTFVLLAACAAFVPTFEAKGVTQSDLFLTTVDSVTGQEVLARHFPAGSGSPVQIIAPQGKADQVVQVLGTIDGVQSPQVGLVPGQPPTVVDGQVLVQATLVAPADSVEAESTVETIRTRLDEVGTEVLVGGSTAVNLDVRQASERDLKVIIPAILGVIFVVLLLLLRSITAPLVLVAANLSVVRRDHRGLGRGVQPRVRLPGVGPVHAALRLRLPRRPRDRLLDLPHDASTRGVPDPGYPAGHPRRARGHRGSHHQRGHRSRVDVLGPRGAADPLPRPDRLHRRVRRPARHLGGAKPARPRPLLRPRRQDLVAVRPASSRGARGGAAEGRHHEEETVAAEVEDLTGDQRLPAEPRRGVGRD